MTTNITRILDTTEFMPITKFEIVENGAVLLDGSIHTEKLIDAENLGQDVYKKLANEL